MKLWRPLTFSLFMVILVLPAAATTQTGLGPYQPLSTIVIPPNSANGNVGALAGGFDISWFDFSTERFFIADRGTIPGAGLVMDARNGNILANISSGLPQALSAADQIWYNPGDNRVYFAGRNLGVVDAETNAFLGFIAPGTQTATSAGGHSIAVDSYTNYVFVPNSGGIKVHAQAPPSTASK
jgi:DNA-binding beta-propeller fold protein YncE